MYNQVLSLRWKDTELMSEGINGNNNYKNVMEE